MSGMSKITVVLISGCLLHIPIRVEPGMESLVRVCVRVCVCVCVCCWQKDTLVRGQVPQGLYSMLQRG